LGEHTAMPFTDRQLVEMLRRSYAAVDGLWFMMSEQDQGFAKALELDDQVWRVMPKLQARKAREVLGLPGNSPAELAQAIGLKLTAEGHSFRVTTHQGGVTIIIQACPWRAALEKAGRLDIAADIGRRICTAEGEGWAAEFGEAFEFRLAECLCDQAERCRFEFAARRQLA
jgi:hypothetical protein